MTQQNGPDNLSRHWRRPSVPLSSKLIALVVLSLLCGLFACVPTEESKEPAPSPQASGLPAPQPEAPTPPPTAPPETVERSDDPASADIPPDDRAVSPEDTGLAEEGDLSEDPAFAEEELPEERSDRQRLTPPEEREIALIDCGSLETQAAMNRCAQQNYAQADADLNEAYRALKAILSEQGEQALTAAEIAWLQFRDLDCDFERSAFTGGSVAPLVYHTCLTERTLARTDELFYPGLPDISYQEAGTQFDETYRALTDRLSEKRQKDITEVQIAWLAYREHHCNFEILYSPNVIEKSQCLARLTDNRIAQLQAYLAQSSL